MSKQRGRGPKVAGHETVPLTISLVKGDYDDMIRIVSEDTHYEDRVAFIRTAVREKIARWLEESRKKDGRG
jgi:hypothetical protein